LIHSGEKMKKQPIFAIGLMVCVLAAHKGAVAANCEVLPDPCEPCVSVFNPCDNVCNPCDSVCQTGPFGKYLTEKSIFDSPLFENRLIGKKSQSRISFYGWMLTGVTVNNHGATTTYQNNRPSHFNYPSSINRDGTTVKRGGMEEWSGNSYVLQTEQQTDWKFNQVWFGAKRDLTDKFDWGFQADFFYGTDGRYSRNWGDKSFDYYWNSGDYFANFPQLFATVGTKKLYAKVGKFAGGFSTEGLAAPREFFYSHAMIAFGRPLVAEGVVVEWNPNKQWTISGGWLAGIMTSMFDNPYDDSAFLGKIMYRFSDTATLSYRVFYNDMGVRPGSNTGTRNQSHIVIFTKKINPNLSYMGEVAYSDNQTVAGVTGDSWGINNHLIYKINDKWSVGTRAEYHYSRNMSFDTRAVTGGEGGDLWEFTLATHYKINPKTTFRPEIRYDYTDYKNYRPFGNNQSNDQISGGCSFIVMF